MPNVNVYHASVSALAGKKSLHKIIFQIQTLIFTLKEAKEYFSKKFRKSRMFMKVYEYQKQTWKIENTIKLQDEENWLNVRLNIFSNIKT